jgi:hypothetical protein
VQASRNKGFQNLPQNQKSKAQLSNSLENSKDIITKMELPMLILKEPWKDFLVGFNGSRIK